MKKNYLIIIVLLLANFFPASAALKEADGAKALCNVAIMVDNASNIKAVTSAGNGTVLTLTDGLNTLTVDDAENPLLIEPTDGATILSIKQNGSEKNPSGDGKYRLGISEGMVLEITTQSATAEPTVTFSVDNASRIVVKANGQAVTDISSPKSFAKETVLTISAVGGYKIKTLSASTVPSVPEVDGVYTLIVSGDVTIYVTTEAVNPVITFDIDFPARVSVIDMETQAAIDVTSGEASVPVGTVLEIQASDAKYSIKSLKVNGTEKQPSGGSLIYNIGISANTTIAIETTSTVPTVKFIVDKPENVKVHLLDSDAALDLSKSYELEKNTQLVIEPANAEVRIASVLANGFKLTPLADGTYMTSVSTDMTLEIKTKGILPGLTFKVDAPERINVLKGTEKLDFSDVVELPEGTQITIQPAADNFIIRSVVANGTTLTAGADQKYLVTVTGDMEFEIKTAANLTLHIVQPAGGKVSVFRNDVELHEGDKVMTGDELLFKNTPDENYVFLNYLVKGEKCIETYMVFGSEDITVSGEFKAVREGYALVTFDIDELGAALAQIKVREEGSDQWTSLDPLQPNEVKKGSKINIYMFTVGVYFETCTMNGAEMTKDGEKSYSGVIDDNAVIKIRIEQRVQVSGDLTNEPVTYLTIGWTYIKYNGEVATSHIVPVGATVEIVVKALEGYELDYLYLNYNEEDKYEGTTYTVENADREIITIKGAFKKASSIDEISQLQNHYDAASMQIITTGGTTQVYTVSGEKVLESADTNISISALRSGLYIVKTQDGIFKIMKK